MTLKGLSERDRVEVEQSAAEQDGACACGRGPLPRSSLRYSIPDWNTLFIYWVTSGGKRYSIWDADQARTWCHWPHVAPMLSVWIFPRTWSNLPAGG